MILLTRPKSPLRNARYFALSAFCAWFLRRNIAADRDFNCNKLRTIRAEWGKPWDLVSASRQLVSSVLRKTVADSHDSSSAEERWADSRSAGNLRRGIALGRGYGKCESCWLGDVGVTDLTHSPREFSSPLLSSSLRSRESPGIENFMPGTYIQY